MGNGTSTEAGLWAIVKGSGASHGALLLACVCKLWSCSGAIWKRSRELTISSKRRQEHAEACFGAVRLCWGQQAYLLAGWCWVAVDGSMLSAELVTICTGLQQTLQ